MADETYGLECFDENGNQTLFIDDTIARLIYTVEAAADTDGNSGDLALLDGVTTIQFALALEDDKLCHEVSRTDNTIYWEFREDWSFFFCVPAALAYGHHSSKSQIFVFAYD